MSGSILEDSSDPWKGEMPSLSDPTEQREMQHGSNPISASQFFNDSAPNELLHLIVQYLTIGDLVYLGCLCKRMKEFCIYVAFARCSEADSDLLQHGKDTELSLFCGYSYPNWRNVDNTYPLLACYRLKGAERHLKTLQCEFGSSNFLTASNHLRGHLDYLDTLNTLKLDFSWILHGPNFEETSPCFGDFINLLKHLNKTIIEALYINFTSTYVGRPPPSTLFPSAQDVLESAKSCGKGSNVQLVPTTSLKTFGISFTEDDVTSLSELFRHWVLGSLQSSPLDELYLEGDGRYTRHLLALNLSCIRKFYICSPTTMLSRVTLDHFLVRADTITVLQIEQGEASIDCGQGTELKCSQDILPNLVSVRAHPCFLSYILPGKPSTSHNLNVVEVLISGVNHPHHERVLGVYLPCMSETMREMHRLRIKFVGVLFTERSASFQGTWVESWIENCTQLRERFTKERLMPHVATTNFSYRPRSSNIESKVDHTVVRTLVSSLFCSATKCYVGPSGDEEIENQQLGDEVSQACPGRDIEVLFEYPSYAFS